MTSFFGRQSLFVGILSLLFSFALSGTALADFDHDNPAHGNNTRDHERHVRVCTDASGESANCYARVVTDAGGTPRAGTVPSGFGPAAFHAAYTPSVLASSKQIIAIVDAYDDSRIQSDLDTYSQTFGIPTLPACTTAIAASSRPCFQKVSQQGSTTRLPGQNAGWSLETALDVETAHAMCQNCGILLVEANSASYADLMSAVDRAVTLGATVVSNSYGSNEFAGETTYDNHFKHPGVAITFSSGDTGYGAQYPASSPYVTAVGGTSLTFSGASYGSETAWTGAGSGCSAYESKPAFQSDSGCAKRTVADVSADADPNTGAAVYTSIRYGGQSGWMKVGGTSLASPIIAGMYALGAVPAGASANALPYANAGALHDILTGSNGVCTPGYLCSAGVGYDGPTGLGSPNGTNAF